MTSRRMRLVGELWFLGAALTLSGLGGASGCGGAAGPGTVVPDGGAGAGGTPGASGKGGSGGRGGGAGSAGRGGAGTAGASGKGGGGTAGAGGANGTGGQPGGQTCMNAPHVLPLNPSNPQDGITLSGFYVDTDTWNAASYQVSQTMYVCDYDSWYVVARMDNATGDGAVKTYPNVHQDFSAAPAISSFSTISSSFAHAGPHVGIYEFAYDIWLNGVASTGSTEVMIWTDTFKQVPSGSVQETVTFDGQSYQVYKSGSYIAFVETTNVTAGSVNLLEFFNHIIAKGWIPSTSTLGAIDYGVELVSTGGVDATFALNGFSLTATK